MPVTFNPISYSDTETKYVMDPNNGTKRPIESEVEKTMDLKEFIAQEVPTTRFWMMLKLKNDGWTKRWEVYQNDLIQRVKERLSGPEKEVAKEVKKTLERIERSAWVTMPSSFLASLNIPRVIRK